jgi:hypothetical protein
MGLSSLLFPLLESSLLHPLLESSSLNPLESSLLHPLLESSALDPLSSLLCSTLCWSLHYLALSGVFITWPLSGVFIARPSAGVFITWPSLESSLDPVWSLYPLTLSGVSFLRPSTGVFWSESVRVYVPVICVSTCVCPRFILEGSSLAFVWRKWRELRSVTTASIFQVVPFR